MGERVLQLETTDGSMTNPASGLTSKGEADKLRAKAPNLTCHPPVCWHVIGVFIFNFFTEGRRSSAGKLHQRSIRPCKTTSNEQRANRLW